MFPNGESGPRRKTLYPAENEPVDTAAANAEAARLARELGVAGDTTADNSNIPTSTLTASSSRSRWRLGGGGKNTNKSSTSQNSFRSQISSAIAPASTRTLRYRDLPSTIAAATTANASATTAAASGLVDTPVEPPLISPNNDTYVPPTLGVVDPQQQEQELQPQQDGQPVEENVTTTRTRSQLFDHPVYEFDQHGQRAPYKEGPFIMSRDQVGRLVKKRWYGRLEDGYLAWSSIYFHEYFGFTIYTPLTSEEEQELKKPDGNIPRWMYEFTSLPNLAIAMSYFCIGVALQLLRTPLIVYFIEDLSATPAEVNVLFTVMAVPWCFKVIYGFLSDCLPINGLRRKPYFMTGWLVYIVSNLVLMINPVPSIQLCILLVFAQTAGYMLADVMTDALIVERSRFETQETRGTLQSKGYILRFFGSTIGATIGAVVYNKDDWNWYLPIRLVFFINAAFPLIFLMPFVPYLLELDSNCHPKNLLVQCLDLFETAQLRAVWQPMTFVYIYNALQLTNAAWMNFLVEGLSFSAWQIGIVSIFGSIMAWFGIMTYKRYFFASNWRIVYFWCTTLASAIALGQLILVFGLNRKIGIPDIWFSMGDDVLVEFVIAVQFLPMCIMYLGLCPPGSEGTTYAMLTTWSNLAGSLAFDISTALTVVWDVSSETIAAGNFSGIWKLSLLCGVIGPLPLVLLGLIPKNKEDQRQLQEDKSRHYWKGVTFITVMIVTLMITFIESIYEVYFNDESDGYDNQRRRLKRVMIGH